MSGLATAASGPLSPEAAARAAKGDDPEAKFQEVDHPLLSETYRFDLDYTDLRGRKWAGNFLTHILDVEERSQMSCARARMLGNTPIESHPEDHVELVTAVCHMQFSLDEKPDWLNFGKLKNPDVIMAIWEEVSSHEDTFSGRRPAPENSAS
jgi:hypothetical protein